MLTLHLEHRIQTLQPTIVHRYPAAPQNPGPYWVCRLPMGVPVACALSSQSARHGELVPWNPDSPHPFQLQSPPPFNLFLSLPTDNTHLGHSSSLAASSPESLWSHPTPITASTSLSRCSWAACPLASHSLHLLQVQPQLACQGGLLRIFLQPNLTLAPPSAGLTKTQKYPLYTV